MHRFVRALYRAVRRERGWDKFTLHWRIIRMQVKHKRYKFPHGM